MNNNERIWQSYKKFKSLAYVTRAGFGQYGIYPLQEDELKLTKKRKPLPESDLEHVAGMIHLIRAVSWYHPEVVPKERLDDFLFGAEIHEIGETVIGDIADDGNRDEAMKNLLETIEIRSYLSESAPEEEFGRGLKIYEEMRDKSTEFGKTLYFFDKLEAVFQALFFESMGFSGRLSYKENNSGLTKRDKIQRTFTKSDNIVDCWSYSLLEKADEIHFEHKEIFKEILISAVTNVRKKPFSWVD